MGKRQKYGIVPDRRSTSEGVDSIPAASPITRKSRRVWLFRIAAVVFPFACLAIAEFALYLAGKGVDPTLVQRSQRNPNRNEYYLNPQVDVAYSRADLRGPEPRGFELPRPEDVIRVIVIGESSVQGYPYPSELAFPRQMELILQRQLKGSRVEVLNAGIIGVSSLPLTDMVRQCIAAQPSAIVVYAGHNEFYGVGGVATNATLSPIAIPLRKTRLIQWLTGQETAGSDRTGSPQGPLISRLPKEVQISPSSPLVRQAFENFQQRMEWIAGYCVRMKIPLLLCSPVSNLRSQSPWAGAESSPALKEIEQRMQGPLSATTSGDYLGELRQQVAAHPDDALLQYRLAQCLELMGESEEAYRSYVLARDLDQCRYRAPSNFGQALSELALRYPWDVLYLDLEPAFREQSSTGIPGDDLFLEHVHFNLEGHWLMARSVGKAIVERILGQPWNPLQAPLDAERDQWLGLVPEDRLVGLYLASFISEAAPFNQALDAAGHLTALKSNIDAVEKSLTPEQLKRFHSLNNAVKTDDLIDGLGRALLGRNQPDQALTYFERSIRRRPWMPNGFVFSAMALQMMGDSEQASRLLQKSKTTVMSEMPRLRTDRERLEKRILRSDHSGAAP